MICAINLQLDINNLILTTIVEKMNKFLDLKYSVSFWNHNVLLHIIDEDGL